MAGLTERPALLQGAAFPITASTRLSSKAASRETVQESTMPSHSAQTSTLQQNGSQVVGHCKKDSRAGASQGGVE